MGVCMYVCRAGCFSENVISCMATHSVDKIGGYFHCKVNCVCGVSVWVAVCL